MQGKLQHVDVASGWKHGCVCTLRTDELQDLWLTKGKDAIEMF